MDKFAAINVFVKVVEQGSFALAADRLDLSTSTVSRHVADLETHLNARLLNRTTRRLSLTEAGQAFYERSVALISDLDEAEAAASASTAAPRGTIKLTCSVAFGIRYVAPAIGAFQRKFPEMRFDISLSERMVDLVEEGLDLAIRIGDLGNANLVARRIAEMRLVVCASPAYLRRHGRPKHPDDLITHNCFTYEYLATRDHWRFLGRDGRLIGVAVKGSVHSNNGEMAVAIAMEGVGIALEPDFIVAPALASGKLVPILTEYATPPVPIYAVYASRRHLSAKVRAFVDFLGERFRQLPGPPAR
jgi:DNA-binding transcriptional LysR family regulator